VIYGINAHLASPELLRRVSVACDTDGPKPNTCATSRKVLLIEVSIGIYDREGLGDLSWFHLFKIKDFQSLIVLPTWANSACRVDKASTREGWEGY
jgi:hypothetical protein